jgi:hypothetical protein
MSERARYASLTIALLLACLPAREPPSKAATVDAREPGPDAAGIACPPTLLGSRRDADLFGNPRLECIDATGGKLTVCQIGGACQEIDYGAGASVLETEARDVLGRGKKDLVVRYLVDGRRGFRHEVLEILTPDAGDALNPVFRQETRMEACCANEAEAPPGLQTEVELSPGAIEICALKPWKWKRRAHDKVSQPPAGVFPIVKPWDKRPVRRYRWGGGAFVPTRPRLRSPDCGLGGPHPESERG